MTLPATDAPAWFAVAVPFLEPLAAERDLFVLPPFPALAAARVALSGSSIGFGGQDVHADDRGAHTGDVSAPMLADLGCRYAEIGHSERRRDYDETDRIVAGKVQAALRWNLTPIVCVGERAQGPAARAIPVVTDQLVGAFGGFSATDLDRVV